MKVGWLAYGYVHRQFKAADGAANIRIPIMEKLLARGDTITWLGPQRKQTSETIKFYNMALLFNADYKTFVKDYVGPTKVKDFIKQFWWPYMPEIDVLIVELNAMGLFMPLTAAIVNQYHKDLPNVKIIIWDLDNILGGAKAYLKVFDIEIENLTVIAAYTKSAKFSPYINMPEPIYYPYNVDAELPIKKGEGLIYVGNDYKRRDKLKKYYDFDFATIYGKYKDEKWKLKMKCEFGGQIQPDAVHHQIQSASFCIQVVHKSYEKIGLMTQRANEVLEAGTLLFVDGSIASKLKFVDKEYIVNFKSDVLKKLDWIGSMSEEEYKTRVQAQRDKVKEFATYDKYLSLFESGEKAEQVPLKKEQTPINAVTGLPLDNDSKPDEDSGMEGY